MEITRVERRRQRAQQARRRLVRSVGVSVGVLVLVGPVLPRLVADRQSAAQPSTTATSAPSTSGGDGIAEDNPVGDLIDLNAAELSSFDIPAEPIALAELSFPRLGVSGPVYDGHYPSVLERGIGQWPGTDAIGEPGRAVLLGHRTTYTAPFNRLDELGPGDEVRVNVFGHGEVVFSVYESDVVVESRYTEEVLAPAPPGERVLTLFACHPKGSRSHRIVVRARAADPPTGDEAPASPDLTARGASSSTTAPEVIAPWEL